MAADLADALGESDDPQLLVMDALLESPVVTRSADGEESVDSGMVAPLITSRVSPTRETSAQALPTFDVLLMNGTEGSAFPPGLGAALGSLDDLLGEELDILAVCERVL